MKNLINKVRHHGKKITIHLKRHHRKYLFGALCSGILALIAVHTVSTINNIFANEEPVAVTITYDSGANITYIDTEWNEFTGIWTITISNWIDNITMLDRNLWATTNDINDTWSYWYYFQWWDNIPYTGLDWNSGNIQDDNSRWWWDDIDDSDGKPLNSYPINNPEYRKWPCPVWYHVPSKWEWHALVSIRGYDKTSEISGFYIDFKLPFAGMRNWGNGSLNQGNQVYLRSSSPYTGSAGSGLAWEFYLTNMIINATSHVSPRNTGLPVRCFKDPDDIVSPTCDVEYSTTEHTTGQVVAYLTWCSETITWTELTYTFTGNWTYTFEFQDFAWNTWSVNAEVTRIDRIVPTCNVIYDVTWATTWNVVASLTGCSEAITWTDLQHTFTGNWTYTFNFQDLAGNTGSTEAIVSYVKNSGDIISLYNANKALSCRHYYKSWNSSQDYKLYVTTWTMYLYLNTSIEGTGIDSHILLTDDKLYQWWSSYSQYFGSWEWMYQIYKFNMENELASFFNDEDFYFICYPWINDMSIFNVPSNVTFRTQGHYSANNRTFFSVSIDDTIKAWENTNFVVKIMKDWATFKGYTGTVYFELTDRNWNIVDRDLYEFSEGRHYKFDESDRWRKTFSVKIKKEWTYVLKLYDSDNEYIEWSEIITVKSNGSSSSFEYDTYKFNPNYSDEMNKAYQYARYYNITTIDSIKDAGMGTWLNRIAMAKMLANYAVNVLGKDDFDKSRNCTFKDVSTSLDRNYYYWVTKACQLGIMWINMPDNKFYPNWRVTRAEFATALSRLLYWTKDWTDKYYSTHITKLYNEKIINNTDPKLREKRWYVMLMLMRAAK